MGKCRQCLEANDARDQLGRPVARCSVVLEHISAAGSTLVTRLAPTIIQQHCATIIESLLGCKWNARATTGGDLLFGWLRKTQQ